MSNETTGRLLDAERTLDDVDYLLHDASMPDDIRKIVAAEKIRDWRERAHRPPSWLTTPPPWEVPC